MLGRYKISISLFAPRCRPSYVRSYSSKSTSILGHDYICDEWTNISSSILPLVGRQLHLQKSHPIDILRRQIESQLPESVYARYNNYSPVVTVHQNFDSLGFPKDHVGRSKSDTYYVNKETVLRTHTSAHQAETFRECTAPGFLISADVYRRDEIDSSHYPVFHQTEGARLFAVHDGLVDEIEAEIAAMPSLHVVVEDPNPPNHPERNPVQRDHKREQSEAVARHLKKTIEMIAAEVFGNAARAAQKTNSSSTPSSSSPMSADASAPRDQVASVWDAEAEPLKVRWIEAYFPFTSPSWELEVWWNGAWLELCGCGVVQHEILSSVEKGDKIGWAFGLGLERIAMILFGIPDIRLFWSRDDRFLTQFERGQVVAFRPYSKYPTNKKDISFWTSPAPIPASAMLHTDTDTDTDSEQTASSIPSPPVPAPAETFQENDFMEIVRQIGGDLIENVEKVDTFRHPRTHRMSVCYRITYRSMDRSLSNDEVMGLQRRIEGACAATLGVELR